MVCPIEAFHKTLKSLLPENSAFTPPENDEFHSKLHAWTLTPAGREYARYLGFEPATLKLKVSSSNDL